MTEQPPKSSLLKKALGFVFFIALGLGGLWSYLWASPQKEAVGQVLAKSAQINALSAWPVFPKQGPNECGAFSLSYGLKLTLSKENAPKDMVSKVSHNISWSEGLSGTVPWKITTEAGENGLSPNHYSAASHPPEKRLEILCQHVSQQTPVIALINSDRNIQHYILVVGYDEESIHIYDPNIEADAKVKERTIDQNGSAPGNRTYTRARFQEVWGQGGMLGLYTWWYLPLKRVENKN